MPLYEYQCEKCSGTVEVMQSINDKPLEKCSDCGGKLKKLISQSAFHLKGSGWYVTDYKGKQKPSCPNNNSCSSCNAGA